MFKVGKTVKLRNPREFGDAWRHANQYSKVISTQVDSRGRPEVTVNPALLTYRDNNNSNFSQTFPATSLVRAVPDTKLGKILYK